MAKKVVINLPVKDLEKSMLFFTKLGYHFDERFTDERAACMIVNGNVFVMFLAEQYFKTFTKKPVSDTTEFSEVLITLEIESKQEIQNIIARAGQMGAHILTAAEDHGWMYQHSIVDLDGHHWEFIFIDNAFLPDHD